MDVGSYGCGRCSVCGSFEPYDEMEADGGGWVCLRCMAGDAETTMRKETPKHGIPAL